jgi:hypothetical protein
MLFGLPAILLILVSFPAPLANVLLVVVAFLRLADAGIRLPSADRLPAQQGEQGRPTTSAYPMVAGSGCSRPARVNAKNPSHPAPEKFANFAKFAKFAKFVIFDLARDSPTRRHHSAPPARSMADPACSMPSPPRPAHRPGVFAGVRSLSPLPAPRGRVPPGWRVGGEGLAPGVKD